MSKYTPGKWKIYGKGPNCRIEAPRSPNSHLVIVERVGGLRLGEQFDDFSQVEANARLIVESPAMFEALALVTEAVNRLLEDGGRESAREVKRALRKARSVMKRIEGEPS